MRLASLIFLTLPIAAQITPPPIGGGGGGGLPTGSVVTGSDLVLPGKLSVVNGISTPHLSGAFPAPSKVIVLGDSISNQALTYDLTAMGVL